MRRMIFLCLLSVACMTAITGCYGRAVRAPRRTISPEELATLQVSPSAPTPLPLVAANRSFATPTSTPSPSVTPLPPTSTATSTPTPFPRARVNGVVVNVRVGPGTSHVAIGQLTQGTIVDVISQTSDAPIWYEVCCVLGRHGWMREDTLDLLPDAVPVPSPTSTSAPTTED